MRTQRVMPSVPARDDDMDQAETSACQDGYFVIYADVHGWGGGASFSTGLASAMEANGLSTLILGITSDPQTEPTTVESNRRNLLLRMPTWSWRLRHWYVVQALTEQLRHLPPPRKMTIAVSPFWAIAARRAWPTVRVVFGYPCLLSNCLPFTWDDRGLLSIWKRLDFAAVRRAERLALALSDYTTAPTRASVEELEQFHPGMHDRIIQCDYGVADVDIAGADRLRARREWKLPEDAFVVGLLGSCDRNKAFDVAIRALPHTDHRCHLLVVGEGPQLDRWKRLARGQRVESRIRFAGSQRDVAHCYGAMDCLLSTSSYDTFPNSALEAMRCGLPIVVPQHRPPSVFSGMAEVVEEYGVGVLYDRRKAASLAPCLNKLASDPSRAANLGHKARELMSHRYRWTDTADAILTRLGLHATANRTPATNRRDHIPEAAKV